jgi:hypothetical protein
LEVIDTPRADSVNDVLKKRYQDREFDQKLARDETPLFK